MNSLRLVFALTVAMGLLGCAAGSKLEQYPRRHIDRGAIAPKGVWKWQPSVWSSTVSSDDDEESRGFGSFLNFEKAFSDQFAWGPVPIGLKWQPIHKDGHTLALEVYYAFIISGMGASYRYKFAPDWAVWAAGFHESFWILWEFQTRVGLAGVQWQISDNWSLSVGRGWQDDHFKDEIFTRIFTLGLVEGVEVVQFGPRTDVRLDWSAHRQWDVFLHFWAVDYRDGGGTWTTGLLGAKHFFE